VHFSLRGSLTRPMFMKVQNVRHKEIKRLTSDSESRGRTDGNGRLIGFKSLDLSTRASLANFLALRIGGFIVRDALVEW
jgi:hypothetical protein